jgi:hypothetical protein
MKTQLKENAIKYAVILMLIVIAFIIGRCGRSGSKQVLNQDTIYVIDTTTHSGVVEKPIAVNQGVRYIIRWKTSNTETVIHDTITKEVVIVDSARCMEIAEDYYSTYSYNRVIVDDSLLTFTIHDTTFMNAIQSSSYEYKINRPQTVIINRPQRPVTVYGGINMFYSKEQGFKPTAGVHIVTNRVTMFYGIGNKCQNAGIYFKLY